MNNKKSVNILQLIDSTEPGGAEMMAVRIANAFVKSGIGSFLLITRFKGGLELQCTEATKITCLERKSRISIQGLFKAIKYVKDNNINVIHAHTGSIYLGIIFKLLYRRIFLIWHDHYGNSEFLKDRKIVFNFIFKYIVNLSLVVNSNLEEYSKKILKIKKVKVIYNFCTIPNLHPAKTSISDECNLLMVANFRTQKNHFLAIDILYQLNNKNPHIRFNLTILGRIVDQEYYNNIINYISDKKLSVLMISDCNDSAEYILKSDICILTSDSEGMPLAIIEYASFAKPIVCTEVGEVPYVFTNNSDIILCDRNNSDLFVDKISSLVSDWEFAVKIGQNARATVLSRFTESGFADIYKTILKEEHVID